MATNPVTARIFLPRNVQIAHAIIGARCEIELLDNDGDHIALLSLDRDALIELGDTIADALRDWPPPPMPIFARDVEFARAELAASRARVAAIDPDGASEIETEPAVRRQIGGVK